MKEFSNLRLKMRRSNNCSDSSGIVHQLMIRTVVSWISIQGFLLWLPSRICCFCFCFADNYVTKIIYNCLLEVLVDDVFSQVFIIMHTCIHIYIHTYSHTHAHIYTYKVLSTVYYSCHLVISSYHKSHKQYFDILIKI